MPMPFNPTDWPPTRVTASAAEAADLARDYMKDEEIGPDGSLSPPRQGVRAFVYRVWEHRSLRGVYLTAGDVFILVDALCTLHLMGYPGMYEQPAR